jgi:hypothetical protein
MNRFPERSAAFCLAGTCLVCAGCGRAPSIDVIGSFFPVWMVCLILSIILAAVLRLLLLRYKLEPAIEPVALFYPAVVLFLSCSLWLIFFR